MARSPVPPHAPTAADEDNALLLQGELADGLRAEIGLRAEFANDWAARLTAYLRRRLGAQSIYIPVPSRVERDAAIFAEFNGSNMADVCLRHDVSRTRVYEICEEQRRQRTGASPLSSLKTGQPDA